jgi:hypothetical protein
LVDSDLGERLDECCFLHHRGFSDVQDALQAD